MSRRSPQGLSPQFLPGDAWILWCIPVDATGTDLCGLLRSADAINHAIPTLKEIEGAVSRGLQAGLIERSGARLRFRPRVRKRIAEVRSVSASWFRQLEALESFLAPRRWRCARVEEYHLAEKEYEVALAEYCARGPG